MTTLPPGRPRGLLPWVLDDAGRTRRLCLMLALVLPALVLVVVSLAVMVFLSPLAGIALRSGLGLGMLGAPAATAAYRWRQRRVKPNLPA